MAGDEEIGGNDDLSILRTVGIFLNYSTLFSSATPSFVGTACMNVANIQRDDTDKNYHLQIQSSCFPKTLLYHLVLDHPQAKCTLNLTRHSCRIRIHLSFTFIYVAMRLIDTSLHLKFNSSTSSQVL